MVVFTRHPCVGTRQDGSDLRGLLVIVLRCFSHNEAERPHKRGQSDNDYPLHYTFSSSSMRLYARRLMSTIMAAMTSVAIKPAPTMIGLAVA